MPPSRRQARRRLTILREIQSTIGDERTPASSCPIARGTSMVSIGRLTVEELDIELPCGERGGRDDHRRTTRGRRLDGRRAGEHRDDALAPSGRPRRAGNSRRVDDVVRSFDLQRRQCLRRRS
jgi:hypothetical protein